MDLCLHYDPNLLTLEDVRRMARRATRSVILKNLVVALGVIAILMAASLTGFIGIGAAIVVHEGSTLLVVANALRLLGYKNV